MVRDSSRTDPSKIPRPSNCFMIFRRVMQTQVTGTAMEKSRAIGRMWKSASKETKDIYRALADEEKAAHELKYPNYKFQPQPKKNNQNVSRCRNKEPYPTTRSTSAEFFLPDDPLEGSLVKNRSVKLQLANERVLRRSRREVPLNRSYRCISPIPDELAESYASSPSTPCLSSGSSVGSPSFSISDFSPRFMELRRQSPSLNRAFSQSPWILDSSVYHARQKSDISEAITQVIRQSYEKSAETTLRSNPAPQIANPAPVVHPLVFQRHITTLNGFSQLPGTPPDADNDPIPPAPWLEREIIWEHPAYYSIESAPLIHRTDYTIPTPTIANALVPVTTPSRDLFAEDEIKN